MRARPWASSVRMGICQPIQERACSPSWRRVRASRPAVTCSPEATTASYSSSLRAGRRRGGRRRRSRPPARWSCRHGRDHHGDRWPAARLRRHQPRDAADALQVGDRGAAELHHQTRTHERRFKPRAPLPAPATAGIWEQGACLAAGAPRRNAQGRSRSHAPPDRRRGAKRLRRRGRGGAVLPHRRPVVGSAWQVRAAASVQSRAAGLHPRPGRSPASTATPTHPPRSRACACSTSAAAAACWPSRCRAWASPSPGWTPPPRTSPSPASTPRKRACSTSTTGTCTAEELLAEDGDGFDVVLNMEVVEHVTDPGRFLRDASRLGEARRADDRGHPEPHPEGARHRPRSARSTSWAGCPAAPMTGASS